MPKKILIREADHSLKPICDLSIHAEAAHKDVARGGTGAVNQKGVGLMRHSHAIGIPHEPVLYHKTRAQRRWLT